MKQLIMMNNHLLAHVYQNCQSLLKGQHPIVENTLKIARFIRFIQFYHFRLLIFIILQNNF